MPTMAAPTILTANCRFRLHLVNVASEPNPRWLSLFDKLNIGRDDCRLEYICYRFESDHSPCYYWWV